MLDEGLEGEEEERMGELNPMEPLERRFRMCFWRPMKAPQQMKRMLSVRRVYVSGLEVGGLVEEEEVEEREGDIVPPERGLLVG